MSSPLAEKVKKIFITNSLKMIQKCVLKVIYYQGVKLNFSNGWYILGSTTPVRNQITHQIRDAVVNYIMIMVIMVIMARIITNINITMI